MAVTTAVSTCRVCGRPIALSQHGWGHCQPFARMTEADRHRPKPVKA